MLPPYVTELLVEQFPLDDRFTTPDLPEPVAFMFMDALIELLFPAQAVPTASWLSLRYAAVPDE